MAVAIFKRGSLLIELLFATALLGTVIIGIYLSFTLAIKMNARSKNWAIANNHLSQRIEEVRSTDFANLNSLVGTQTLSDLNNGELKTSLEDYQSNTNIKKMTARLSWTEQGKTRTIEAETLAVRGGL